MIIQTRTCPFEFGVNNQWPLAYCEKKKQLWYFWLQNVPGGLFFYVHIVGLGSNSDDAETYIFAAAFIKLTSDAILGSSSRLVPNLNCMAK